MHFSSAWLAVNGKFLDFEMQQIWSIKINVSDGVFSDSFSLLVEVKDEPDNPPAWQNIPSVYPINETMPAVSIILVSND